MNGLCINGQIDMPRSYIEQIFDDIAITVIDLQVCRIECKTLISYSYNVAHR